MQRAGYLIFSIFLISATSIFGLSRDTGPFELAVIKAPEGPFKIRQPIPNQPRRKYPENADYAFDQLALRYIEDAAVKDWMSKAMWCGTPTVQYLTANAEPSEEFLMAQADKIERRVSSYLQIPK